MFPHLSERIVRQFDYMQFVLIEPSESTHPAMTLRDVGVIYDDYLNHLVPDAACGTLAPKDGSIARGYIQWYLMGSHPYMTLNSLTDPSKSVHQEILEEKRVRAYHVIDVLFICRCIMDMAQAGINM